MAKKRAPRSGSLQFWPRVRAKREYPKTRSWDIPKHSNETKLLGFAGYKVGMTHVMVADQRKNSLSKGMEISVPVTIIECPALKIFSIRFYKKTTDGLKAIKEIVNPKLTKENLKFLNKKITLKKAESKTKLEEINPNDFDDIRINVFTSPDKTNIGKKKPEIFEMGIGGKIEDKLNFIKEKLDKEINVDDVLKENELVDAKAVTTGKGFQGPVKRFGISLRSHRSEKSIRNPGSLGPWIGQGHIMWRIAHAGKMGYHTRTDYNKQILLIGDDPSKINIKGGFRGYGVVKNKYVLIRGSVPGPKKRLIRINHAIRPKKQIAEKIGTITYISQTSQQGK